MTRLMAKEKMIDVSDMELYIEGNELINKIYDDFENRTCSNCSRFSNDNPMLHKKGYCNEFLRYEHGTFGCNHFKQREEI